MREKLKVKTYRVQRGYSQRDMAMMLGIATSTYNAWEQDINNVTIDNVKRIASILKVDWKLFEEVDKPIFFEVNKN